MSTKTRIDRVARHLSPKQLVILDIRESRQEHESFVDHGRAAAIRGWSKPTLMSRIEASVTGTTPGLNRQRRDDLIRSAQREGLFLGRLSQLCAVTVSEQHRELELMTGLLLSQYVILHYQVELGDDNSVLSWRKAAVAHLRRMRVLAAAVALIEREYFDGTTLLFRDSQQLLEVNIKQTTRVLENLKEAAERIRLDAEKHGGHSKEDIEGLEAYLARWATPIEPNPDELESAARRQAWKWVTLVKAQVLDDCDRRHEATALLSQVVLDDEDGDGPPRLLPGSAGG